MTSRRSPIDASSASSASLSDPWDWDIDQVVAALCGSGELFQDSVDPLSRPDPAFLESALRLNVVSGPTLLTEINIASLRDELGLKPLGQRTFVVHQIRDLRRRSQKYYRYIQTDFENPYLSNYGGASTPAQSSRNMAPHLRSPYQYNSRVTSFVPGVTQTPITPAPTSPNLPHTPLNTSIPDRRPSIFHNSLLPTTEVPPPECQTSISPTICAPNSESSSRGARRHSPEAIGFDARQDSERSPGVPNSRSIISPGFGPHLGEHAILKESGQERRNLHTDQDSSVVQVSDVSELALKPNVNSENEIPILAEPQALDAPDVLARGGGRKRIQPTLITSEEKQRNSNIDQVSSIVHGSDTSELLQEPSEKFEIEESLLAEPQALIAPGILLIDDQGRKRMRPILITNESHDQDEGTSEEMLAKNLSTVSESSKNSFCIPQIQASNLRNPEEIYLGVRSLSIDIIFYSDAKIGQEVDHSVKYGRIWNIGDSNEQNSFLIFGSPFGNGQRRYVGARIKHYLLSRKSGIFGHKGQATILPYPDSLAKKHHPLSATVFRKTSGKIVATRTDRSKWLGKSSQLSQAQKFTSNPFSESDEFSENSENVNKGWDYLEKWNHMDGNDEILPVYGDSNSEGEYDLDTWREIEEEQGKLKRPKRPTGRPKSKKLSRDEVDQAIETAMKNIIDHWELVHLPMLHSKAWRLWMKSRRDHNTLSQVGLFTKEIKRLDGRLIKLVKEIGREEWATIDKVIKQCNCMEASLFERQIYRWKISVLESKSAPKKLPPRPKKPKVATRKPLEPLKDSEEDIWSEANESESSDDDLDGFVVDDDSEDAFFTAADEDDGEVSAGENNISEAMAEDMDNAADVNIEISDLGSDVIKPENVGTQSIMSRAVPLLQSSSKRPLNERLDIIDLTQLSESSEDDASVGNPGLATPIPVLPISAAKKEHSPKREPRKSTEFKIPPMATDVDSIVVDLDSDISDEEAMSEAVLLSQWILPELHEVDRIHHLSADLLVERNDRKRLLIWTIDHTHPFRRQRVAQRIVDYTTEQVQSSVWAALKTFEDPNLKIDEMNEDASDDYMLIAAWYVCWTIPVRVGSRGIKQQHIEITSGEEKGFQQFYQFLQKSLKYYEALDIEAPTKQKRRALRESSEESSQPTPHKKRKYAVPESQETINKRANAQKRVRERDQRQKQLKLRFQEMGVRPEDQQQVIVNPGKLDDQDFVYLNPKIADRIQPHQIEGLQFMWREVIADRQGCLLAQTMGLGKTMQVIALLVTIAEAAKSENENIRNQVPEDLRQSRTLILCPPALIENWWEEFLLWTPSSMKGTIGEVRKVTAALKLSERLEEIEAWKDEGGVLLVGFTTYRDLILNPSRGKSEQRSLDEAQHEIVRNVLLDRPSIIVADEAHAAKTLSSGINKSIRSLKSMSRIAMTGSPLANNLEEYHTLIDWIAPGYLGTRLEFKANYEERIKPGLYQESTSAQYRDSLKWLEVLKKELEPKVHRADISVLQKRLKEKQEFVIRVPLTPLQEQLYRVCVDTMATFSNKYYKSSTAWALLSVLRLLCNHPKCFKDKMLAPNDQGNKKRLKKPRSKVNLDPLDEVDELVDAPVSDIGISQSMIETQLAPFNGMTDPVESVTLSNKMQILMAIVLYSREARDKVLLFTHSIDTLNYVEEQLKKNSIRYSRIDGKVVPTERQRITKEFNSGALEACIVSTRAGGQGLNLFGANRVVIIDDHFNPTYEEQAVGRAYRIGQMKPVFVYHLMVGGTFEEVLHNQSVFKQQLAKRVVDKKNPVRSALQNIGEYLLAPKPVKQQELGNFIGKDYLVLDRILAEQNTYVLNLIRGPSY